MPLPTYLHPSSHGLFTSINTNAESWTHTSSPYTHSLNPGRFSGPYTPPLPPVQKKEGKKDRWRSRSQTKGKDRKVVSLLTHKAEASKQQLNSHRKKKAES